MLARDVVIYGLSDAEGREVRGVEAFKAFHEKFREAFPDIQVTVEDTVAEGDKIAALCTVRGTHGGEGIGLAPTKRAIEFTGMCMLRVVDGKIAEAWNSFDFLSLYQQLGAINLPA